MACFSENNKTAVMPKWLLGVSIFAAAGCASLSKERGHKEVATIVQQRIGQRTAWEQGSPEDKQVAKRVAKLLGEGLTRERAIDIALVNNPSLQATYEELGVSQADMVQAGLLSNPVLSGSVGFPSTSAGRIEYEASLVENFLSIFVLPLRKKIAKRQFEADTLRVAHGALRVAAQVSQTFAEVQASIKLVELQRTVLEAAQAAKELAERQYEAGNIRDLDLATQRAAYQQSKFDLAHDELVLIKRREQLNRLLGLWGPQTRWSIAANLPELPARDPALEHLESTAIKRRLDIAAARKRVLLFSNALQLARGSRLTGIFEVGVHVHQDPDGPRLFGPTLSLELPIFDQRQAVIGRLEAQQRQAQRQLRALSIDARSRVRVARVELLTARQRAEHYRTVLLPLREQVVENTQLQYNGMQLGLYQLLEAKREQIETYRGYITALQDYWSARAELERLLGGRIPMPKHSRVIKKEQAP